MVTAGRDVAPVSAPLSTTGSTASDKIGKVEHLPAIEILNRRGEYSATMGCIPPLLRPLAKKLPWFTRGLESVRKLAGIAIAAVGTRLELEESGGGGDQGDLLSKLMKGKDENGNPMGREELTAEALTQLIAGEFADPRDGPPGIEIDDLALSKARTRRPILPVRSFTTSPRTPVW